MRPTYGTNAGRCPLRHIPAGWKSRSLAVSRSRPRRFTSFSGRLQGLAKPCHPVCLYALDRRTDNGRQVAAVFLAENHRGGGEESADIGEGIGRPGGLRFRRIFVALYHLGQYQLFDMLAIDFDLEDPAAQALAFKSSTTRLLWTIS